MNAEQLLAHFNRVADAPDAIPRLRRFILDLAVRGKLVEQDPNDEPASELLKRIQAEKTRLARASEIRKEKPRSPLAEDELPFRVPRNWRWSQLAEIGLLNPRNSADDTLQASFVPMPLISAEYGVANQHDVRPWGEIKRGFTHFADGDVALAKITPCFENGKSTVFHRLAGGIGAGTTELHVIRPVMISADYVLIFLKCPHFIESGIPKMTGTAGQKRVPTEYFAHSPFPLPPLAEQHRIVAKVAELMALCDQLEAAQGERESRRDRLVAASLHRLNQPTDASNDDAFREHACFHLDQLSRLTTRPDQIKQLRETILNLAVCGRLVRQDVRDEPSWELLKRIALEKDRTAAKNRRQSAITSAEVPGAVPSSWVWVRTNDICREIADCPHSTPVFVSAGVVCIDTNTFKQGVLIPSKIRYVSEQTYLERVQRLVPRGGDVVFAREGIVGSTVIVPEGMKCCLGQRVMLFRPAQGVLPSYLSLAISEPSSLARLLKFYKGIGAKHVNVADMRNALIPLPPAAEQHRIVARVNELMALCDRLEAQLVATQTESRRLLEALLHEALASAA